MITRISIENFKGIGDRITVPIRPITLLFGPNSAGKSSIMHAIHYAREVLERHNLDADQTILGGDYVDLGGYRNFIHDRITREPIVLEFELDLRSAAALAICQTTRSTDTISSTWAEEQMIGLTVHRADWESGFAPSTCRSLFLGVIRTNCHTCRIMPSDSMVGLSVELLATPAVSGFISPR